MVRNIIAILKREVSGLHEAAFLLGFFAIASQILALGRDRLLAHLFGASGTLDIYYAAFKVPDLIYTGVASFVSITVLIPFLSRFFGGSEDQMGEEAKTFLNSIFSAFLLAVLAVSAVIFVFMPVLSPLVAPGFDEAALAKLTAISRILLLSPILLGLSNLFGSITQLYRRFFIYALAPVLYNLGIILGAAVIYPIVGFSGLGWGVALGALLHLLIQIPVLVESGFSPRFSLNINGSVIKDVIRLSLPRTIALSTSLLSLTAITALASLIYSGSIAVFNFSLNLQSVPLSIIGVSYSVAAFPALAGFFSRGERNKFAEHIVEALRHIIFWSLPVTALFIVLRAQIVRVILGSGAFSWADTRLVAAALALFSVSLLAQSAVLLLVRGFYAAGETKVPLLVNFTAAAGTVAGAFGLVYIFNSLPVFKFFIESLLRVEGIPGTAILMLPLAYSLGMIINALALWFFFKSRHMVIGSAYLRRTTFESFAAAVFIGFTAYLSLSVFGKLFGLETFWGVFGQGFFAGIIGILFGLALLKLLNSRELEDIIRALKSRFWKSDVIAPEMPEL